MRRVGESVRNGNALETLEPKRLRSGEVQRHYLAAMAIRLLLTRPEARGGARKEAGGTTETVPDST